MANQQVLTLGLTVRAVPVPPSFLAAADPLAASVVVGDLAAFSLSFTAVAGYSNPIALAVPNLPAGAVATFSQDVCQVTDTVSLVIATDAVAIGDYTFQVVCSEVEPAGKKKSA